MITKLESHKISEKNIRENLRNIEQSLEEAQAHLRFCQRSLEDAILAGYTDKIISNVRNNTADCQRTVDYWELEVEEFTSKCAEYLI